MMFPATWSLQSRTVSENALYEEVFRELTWNVLNRVRLACLPQFETLRETFANRERQVVSIPIKSEQMEQFLLESVKVVKESEKFASRRDLLRKAAEDLASYYVADRTVKFPREELEKRPGLPHDDRLFEWANAVFTATFMHLEVARGVPQFEIPEEDQPLCCYRYAFSAVGVEVREIIRSTNIFRIFQKYGFHPTPSPQNNDLVLFLRGNVPVHLGIWREGQIFSKEGNNSPVAYLRPLEDLSPQYGDQVLYLQKITAP